MQKHRAKQRSNRSASLEEGRRISAHHILHPGLRRAVAEFLDRERPAMASEREALAAASPYRREDGG